MSKILSSATIGASTGARRTLASAAALLAVGALLAVWAAPTTSEAQPKFDVEKVRGEVPTIPPGLLQALRQHIPGAVAISVVKEDGTAQLLAATPGQPIYDSEPPLPPGQKTYEETVYRFTYVTNPTCIWQWVGGQYILVVGNRSQCIQG